MALRLTNPPRELTEEVRSLLLERSRRRRFVTPALSRSTTSALALSVPHPVFVLSLDDLTSGGGLGAAAQIGWRYLIREDERTIAAVEVPLTRADAGGGLQLNEGQFVGATDEAITQIENSAALSERDFELRLVRVMALYTMAIWLHNEGPAEVDDLVMPIGQTHPALESGTQYSAEEFVERLRGPAREQLSIDTSPQE